MATFHVMHVLESVNFQNIRISKFLTNDSKGLSIKCARKIFRKTNISNPLIRTRTCAYQDVRNVSFSENFTYVLNG